MPSLPGVYMELIGQPIHFFSKNEKGRDSGLPDSPPLPYSSA
jgi:hypothetical protein